MQTLRISDDLNLPLEAVTQTFAILAKRRVGKTYTASVMAEEMAKVNLPFVALDPTGAWWGLRSKFPVIIIGGEHGDVPLEYTAGRVIAELVVDHPGFYIIDLSHTESDAQQDKFATDFATRLYRLKEKHRDPLHLFIDEADSFAPQRPFENQKTMLGAFEALVRRGGIRGIGVTLITQRPAVLNKNVLNMTEIIIALQTTAPLDQDAAEDWVKRNATKEQLTEFMSSLASLKLGEAWFYSPAWLEIFQRIHIRQRESFNSSATPKVGEKRVEPKRLAPVDVANLRERMAETIEKAKADDPKELRKLNAALQQDVKRLEKQLASVKPVEKVIERPAVSPAEMKRFESTANGLIATGTKMGEWSGAVVEVGRQMLTTLKTLHSNGTKPTVDHKRVVLPAGKGEIPVRQIREAVKKVSSEDDESPHISGVKQKIVDVLAQLEAIGIERPNRLQVVLMSGYTNLRSTGFVKAIGKLRSDDLVTYPDEKSYQLTAKGRAAANPVDQPASNEELQATTLQLLGGKKAEILKELLDVYPNSMLRTDLMANTGYTNLRSTGFVKAIGTLRTFGLVEYPDSDTIKASSLLFIE